MRRRWLAALALVASLLAAGCRVQADVSVTVEEQGTGEVVVAVTLDAEAAERIPDLATQLEASDLEDAGWSVSEVEATPDGGARVSATKRYGSPEQLAQVLDEVSGDDGPFAQLGLERTHELAETQWTFSGEVDPTEGVAAAFSDDELAELLGGQPLGYDLEALAEELGRPVDELVEWTLRADFVEASTVEVDPPGRLDSATREDGGQAVRWSGTFADEQPTTVSATASRTDTTTRILVAVAAAALVLLVVLLLVRLVRGRRRRKRERRAQAEAAAASVGQPAPAGLVGTSVRPLTDEPTSELPVVTPPTPPPPPHPPVGPPEALPTVDDVGPDDDDLFEDLPEHDAGDGAAEDGSAGGGDAGGDGGGGDGGQD